jgi:hypothetical protein
MRVQVNKVLLEDIVVSHTVFKDLIFRQLEIVMAQMDSVHIKQDLLHNFLQNSAFHRLGIPIWYTNGDQQWAKNSIEEELRFNLDLD